MSSQYIKTIFKNFRRQESMQCLSIMKSSTQIFNQTIKQFKNSLIQKINNVLFIIPMEFELIKLLFKTQDQQKIIQFIQQPSQKQAKEAQKVKNFFTKVKQQFFKPQLLIQRVQYILNKTKQIFKNKFQQACSLLKIAQQQILQLSFLKQNLSQQIRSTQNLTKSQYIQDQDYINLKARNELYFEKFINIQIIYISWAFDIQKQKLKSALKTKIKIKRLLLFGCQAFDNQLLSLVIQNNPDIQELNVNLPKEGQKVQHGKKFISYKSLCSLNSLSLSQSFKFYMRAKKLINLNVPDCQNSSSLLRQILDQKKLVLKQLALGQFDGITQQLTKQVKISLLKMNKIERLKLIFVRVDTETLKNFLKNNTNLISLSICKMNQLNILDNSNFFDDQCLRALFDKQHRQFKELLLQGCIQIQLDFEIPENCLQTLILSKLKKKLFLDECDNINRNKAIKNIRKQVKSLKTLSLCENLWIGNSFLKDLNIDEFSQLQHFYLSDCLIGKQIERIYSLTCLQSLYLQNIIIQSTQLTKFSQILKNIESLRHLSLNCLRIKRCDNKEIHLLKKKQFVEYFQPYLKKIISLNINNLPQIDNSCIKYQICPRLKVLQCVGTKISYQQYKNQIYESKEIKQQSIQRQGQLDFMDFDDNQEYEDDIEYEILKRKKDWIQNLSIKNIDYEN